MKRSVFFNLAPRKIAFILFLLLALTLTACSNKKDDDKTKVPEPEEPPHVCEFGQWEDVVVPTCSRNGKIRRRCECGKTETLETPKKEHELIFVEAQEATCTESGYEEYEYCSLCTYTTFKEIKPSHELVKVDGVQPTCYSDGYASYQYCTECSYTTYKFLERLPHLAVSVQKKNATCTEEGYEAYEYCPNCEYTTFVSIPVAPHSTVQVAKSDPTCTESGHEAYEYCTECSYTTYSQLPALDHSLTFVQPNPPTCTKSGHYGYDWCSRCSYNTYEEVPPTHSLTTVDAKEPTCTTVGWNSYQKCTLCDYSEYIELPFTEHVVIKVGATEATCLTSGHTAYEYCNNCSYTTYKFVEAKGHSIQTVDRKPNSCTEAGWDAYEYCTVCDYTTFKAIPAAHSPITVPAQASTCTEKGYAEYEYCSLCTNYTTYKELPLADHSYSLEWTIDTPATPTTPGVMSHHCVYGCGHTNGAKNFPYYTEGLVFTAVSGGYAVSRGTATGDIIIPEYYLDMPVIAISENGFANAVIDSIKLPDTLLTIGAYAFDGASIATRELALPNTLKSIGIYAIEYSNIIAIDFGSSCPALTSGYGMIRNIQTVKVDSIEVWLNLPADQVEIQAIGCHLIVGGELITEIVIPESITNIKNGYALIGLGHVNKLTVHKNINIYSTDITEIHYTGSIKDWCESSKTISYPKDKEITLYIGGKQVGPDLVIPEGVTSIRKNAFAGVKLNSLSLPNSLVSIGNGAFASSELKEITIPENVTSIGSGIVIINEHDITVYYNAINAVGSNIIDVTCGEIDLVIGDKVKVIPENSFNYHLRNVTFSYSGALREIGAKAFYSDSTKFVTSLIIPDSVTSIGKDAFYYWWPEWVYMPNSLEYTFEYPTLITNEAIRKVGDFEFLNAGGEWYLIGYNGASKKPSLPETIDGKKYVYAILEDYEGDITSLALPEGIKIYERVEFSNYSALEELVIMSPDENISLRYIDTLKYVYLGRGIKNLPSYAFEYCTSLETVVIAEGLETIGYNAFYNSPVKKLVLPSTLYEVGDSDNYNIYNAFVFSTGDKPHKNANNNCLSLIDYYGYVQLISDDNGFTAYLDKENKAHLISYSGVAESIVISEICGYPIIEICTGVFSNNCNFTQVKIGDNVETIRESAFYSCDRLYLIELGENLCAIGDGAFGLTYIKEIINYSSLDIKAQENGFGGIATYATSVKTKDHNATTEIIGDFLIVDGIVSSYLGTSKDPVLEINGYYEYLYIGSNLFGDLQINSFTVNAQDTKDVYFLENALREQKSLTSVALNLCSYSDNAFLTFRDSAFRGCSSLIGINSNATVFYINDYAFADCTSLTTVLSTSNFGKYSYMNCVSITEVSGQVITVGKGAFMGCTSLESVYLENAGRIEYYAFSGCTALSDVTIIPNDFHSDILSYAFENCSFKSFDIGNASCSVLAFSGCDQLESITVGETGSFFKDWDTPAFAFGGSSIRSITVDSRNENTIVMDGVLYCRNGMNFELLSILPYVSGVIEIPGVIDYVGLDWFDDYTNVTGFIINEGVLTIAAPERYYESILLPSSVTMIFSPYEMVGMIKNVTMRGDGECYRIKDNVIYDCTNGITVVGIGIGAPATLELINGTDAFGIHCFANGNRVAVLILPDSMTYIDENMFDGYVSHLSVIVISESVTESRIPIYLNTAVRVIVNKSSIPTEDLNINYDIEATNVSEYRIIDGKFGYVIADGIPMLLHYNGEETEKIVFPDSIESKGYYFFANLSECDWLIDVELRGATKIFAPAFRECENLKSIVFGDMLEEIKAEAFAYCYSLEELYFPKSLTFIGVRAFYYCTSLKRVEFEDKDGYYYQRQTGSNPFAIKVTSTHCPEALAEYFASYAEWGYYWYKL